MAQHLVEKRTLKQHDNGRTARMALYGGGTYNTARNPPKVLYSLHYQLARNCDSIKDAH